MATLPTAVANIRASPARVAAIKEARAHHGLTYEIADKLLQRIMNIVYEKALLKVLERTSNFKGAITVEDVAAVHSAMYEFVGKGGSIPLNVLLGLSDSENPLLGELFGSVDRRSVFGDITGIIDPHLLNIRFGKFPGTSLNAIFLENIDSDDNIQYHMTIGPDTFIDDYATGYHLSNYFYGNEPTRRRTYYSNNGREFANVAAARVELIRRTRNSNQIKAVLENMIDTPIRKSLFQLENMSQEELIPSGGGGGGGGSSASAALPPVMPLTLDAKIIDEIKYPFQKQVVIHENKLSVAVQNPDKTYIYFPLGRLMHHGGEFYSGYILNSDGIPIRSSRGRNYIVDFEKSMIPKQLRIPLLADAISLTQPSTSSSSSSSARESIVGEPLPIYLERENFSRTLLGDALYYLIIAYMSNIMPSSPKKLNIDSALYDVVYLLFSMDTAHVVRTAPEYPLFRTIFERYNLSNNYYKIQGAFKSLLADLEKMSDEEEKKNYRRTKIRELQKLYPAIPTEDYEEVLNNTIVTDPELYFKPPLYVLMGVISNRIKRLDGKPFTPQQIDNILVELHDAAKKTPPGHPSIEFFKSRLLDTTDYGLKYAHKYGHEFRGLRKQKGGLRRKTVRRKRLLRRTRKAN